MTERILFLTIGDYRWASSRIRSYWPAEIMPEADAMQFEHGGAIPDDYDVYVWMKTADLPTMQRHARLGKLSFVEVCDPSWWFDPHVTRQVIDTVTACVAASGAARDDMLQWYGTPKRCYVIPDRMKLDQYPVRRRHAYTSPVRLIWFGMSQNRASIFGAIPVLQRLAANGYKIELTICDNAPQARMFDDMGFAIYHTPWSLSSENEIIAAHDIALLPPYPGPWGPLKTNNKVLTAWACGLPAVDGFDYYQLSDLIASAGQRRKAANAAYEELLAHYTIQHTVDDWRRVIAQELQQC